MCSVLDWSKMSGWCNISSQLLIRLCSAPSPSSHWQVHIFKSGPGGYCHHHSVILRQTYSQRLRFKLLWPPSALCSGCGDEMVVKLWCLSLICFFFPLKISAPLFCSCTDQKALRLAKLSVALWVLAIICWISDRFGCSFWRKLNFCYLHGIW